MGAFTTLAFIHLFLVQVHPGGLRHIRPDRRINEWKVPGRRQITKAATNEQQVGWQ
jgi:splicing factor 3B subunit 3